MSRVFRVWLALAMLAAFMAATPQAQASPVWKSHSYGTITAAVAETSAVFNTSDFETVFVTIQATADTLNVSYQVSYNGGTTWAQFEGVAAANVFTGSGTASTKVSTVILDEVGVTGSESTAMGIPIPRLRVICTADPTASAASNGDADDATNVSVTVAGKR